MEGKNVIWLPEFDMEEAHHISCLPCSNPPCLDLNEKACFTRKRPKLPSLLMPCLPMPI